MSSAMPFFSSSSRSTRSMNSRNWPAATVPSAMLHDLRFHVVNRGSSALNRHSKRVRRGGKGPALTETLPPRSRKVKILATLGPASSTPQMIRKLMLAGADAFRINMSHGDQKQKAKLVGHIRALEKEFHRPTTILFDLQGPKLRVGHFEGGRTVLEKGRRFIFDRDEAPGDESRVQLP